MKQEVFLMGKTLVAYFSASGVTKSWRRRWRMPSGPICLQSNRRFPTRVPISTGWTSSPAAPLRCRTPRPVLKSQAPARTSRTTTPFLSASPIWWYVAPTIVNTFLESCDLTGKTVVPFATSGGSGMGGTNKALAPSCTGARLLEGKVFRSSTNADTLREWVKTLK